MSTRAPRGRERVVGTPPLPERAPPPAAPLPEPEPPRERRRLGGFLAARSVRAKILAVVILLLAASAVLSTFVIRQLLLIRLNDRIEDAGQQEVLELDRLLAVGTDPETGEPFDSPTALFNAYLQRNVPSSEEALLTFVDGSIHRFALGRFPLDRVPSEPIRDWEDLSSRRPEEPESVTGRFETDLGTAHFRVRRVVLGGTTGAFVVAILPAAELEEIGDLQVSGVVVILGILLVASGIAWLIAGRVLSPVANLAQTARTISRSDLTRRIEVRGTGEAADMARSFNAMLDRLEAVFRSEREFVADASHELRDPLTICRGHLELLGDDPEERRETIRLVVDELDRMGRIVDQLQLLAETEQPNVLQLEWVDVELFAHELVAKAGALAPRQWSLDHSAQGLLLCDRARLTEGVMNLAHNAVQHTLEDETIAIGVSLGQEEARIWVRDTGRGISLPDQSRIFDRFTRGSGAHRRYRGGGLGLAIVKAIAEAHGGHMELQSRLGEGSTFTIVIPRPSNEGVPDGQGPDR
jgi:two-component system, OmpR family, sensor kinase